MSPSEAAKQELDAFCELFTETADELPDKEAKLRLLFDVAESLGRGMRDAGVEQLSFF